jgi:hypothetical protein
MSIHHVFLDRYDESVAHGPGLNEVVPCQFCFVMFSLASAKVRLLLLEAVIADTMGGASFWHPVEFDPLGDVLVPDGPAPCTLPDERTLLGKGLCESLERAHR